MSRGGKREGAGRPKGEPTKTVRVPERAADAAPELAAHFLAVADAAFRDAFAGTIERNKWDPVVQLLGIETVEARGLIGGSAMVQRLRGVGEMGGIRAEFYCGLSGEDFDRYHEEAA